MKVNKVRILLVEDRVGSQRAAVRLLQHGRFHCVTEIAETGMMALTKVKNNRYDLIFMEINLTDISGIALTRKIRQWEQSHQRKPVPIVALTADADPYECFSAGMQHVIAKPMSEKQACDVLEKYVMHRFF